MRTVKHERDCYECAVSDSGWCDVHTPKPRTSPEAAPRTAAGRAQHDHWHDYRDSQCNLPTLCAVLQDILAIEAEAAQPATPVGALDIEAVGDLIFRAYMHGWADAGMAPDPNAVVHQLLNSARLAAASEPAGGGEGS